MSYLYRKSKLLKLSSTVYHTARLGMLLTAGLLSTLTAQAQLPLEIQMALQRANLSPENISLVIAPVNVSINVPDNTPVNAQTDTSSYQQQRLTPSLQAHRNRPHNQSQIANQNATQTTFSPLKRPISHQATTQRTPASVMKLIPTWVALEMLGKDFTWHTRVYYTGSIINHRLHGDLLIQGSGDPKLTHERLEQLLYQVKQAGIDEIEGNIIIDTSIFRGVTKDPALFDNDPLRPYNASPDGFLVNFNTLTIDSEPTRMGFANLSYTPMLANYQLPEQVRLRRARCHNIKASLNPRWQVDKLVFYANMPTGCGRHQFYIAYPNPKDFSKMVVQQLWTQMGNRLSGQVISQEFPLATTTESKPATANNFSKHNITPLPIASYPSYPLSEQIYDINHYSNNVMTEQLTLSLPVYAPLVHPKPMSYEDIAKLAKPKPDNYQTKHPLYPLRPKDSLTDHDHYGNYPKALATIRQWWKSHLKTPPPHMTNGSGLCRECTLTASNLNELLQYAYQQPDFETYRNSLGIAGVSGTIAGHRKRLPNSSAIGRAWIKTGTLDNVTAMAGYVKGQSGQDYTVVGIINTPYSLNASTARPVLDTMLDWTARH